MSRYAGPSTRQGDVKEMVVFDELGQQNGRNAIFPVYEIQTSGSGRETRILMNRSFSTGLAAAPGVFTPVQVQAVVEQLAKVGADYKDLTLLVDHKTAALRVIPVNDFPAIVQANQNWRNARTHLSAGDGVAKLCRAAIANAHGQQPVVGASTTSTQAGGGGANQALPSDPRRALGVPFRDAASSLGRRAALAALVGEGPPDSTMDTTPPGPMPAAR